MKYVKLTSKDTPPRIEWTNLDACIQIWADDDGTYIMDANGNSYGPYVETPETLVP